MKTGCNGHRSLGIKLDFNHIDVFTSEIGGLDIQSSRATMIGIRGFWIEHGKPAAERSCEKKWGKRQGNPCVINHWMVDGSKDAPVDRFDRRAACLRTSYGRNPLAEKISKDHCAG